MADEDISPFALLALRKTDPKGFFPKLFSRLTRLRLMTRYPHGGIVVDGVLYHATFKNQLNCEDFNPDGWDLFHVPVNRNVVLLRFFRSYGAKYDWISLLAFIVPWRVSMSEWFYCYEWCWFALTGEMPKRRITPEDLLTLSGGRYGN